MANCTICGDELHPERAEKYDYCTKRSCRERAAKALRIASVGVNKAADQFVVLDEHTGRDGEGPVQEGAGGLGVGPDAFADADHPHPAARSRTGPTVVGPTVAPSVERGAGATRSHVPGHGDEPRADREKLV